MEKLKKIAELLNGKGCILVRNANKFEGGKWYVHCWLERARKDPDIEDCEHYRVICINEKDIYNQVVSDIDTALDEIIKKLEEMENEN